MLPCSSTPWSLFYLEAGLTGSAIARFSPHKPMDSSESRSVVAWQMAPCAVGGLPFSGPGSNIRSLL